MKSFQLQVLALSAACFAVEGALAQCIFRQPWRFHRASHESRVESCQTPIPLDRVALDDFVCEAPGVLVRLRWWGVLLTPEQAHDRPYYIAIYADNGNCQPAQRAYWACVNPRVKRVGTDCNGDPVFLFSARVPAFNLDNDVRYWLQISESDEGSARPGVEDFRWSGRRPQQLCDAVQRTAAGGFISPLLDICDQQPDDLSFALGARAVTGVVTIPGYGGVITFDASLHDPLTGQLLESTPVEVFPGGFWEWWPEVGDGAYELRLRGQAAPTLSGTVQVQDGTEAVIDFPDWYLGDLTGDEQISLVDLSLFLGNFGL